MKQAISVLAVFLSLSAASQQQSFPIKNELPDYKPVKFELHKKFTSPNQSYVNNNTKEGNDFSLIKNTTTSPAFKTLQVNLSYDKQFFKLQQKKTEWTDFFSGTLNSYSRQRWFENKNNEQQRWMAQKIKGKQ